MDFQSIYHLVFETYAGIGILVGLGLVISVIACIIMEIHTRKTFVDRGPRTDDDDGWSFFDDDDDDDDDDEDDD